MDWNIEWIFTLSLKEFLSRLFQKFSWLKKFLCRLLDRFVVWRRSCLGSFKDFLFGGVPVPALSKYFLFEGVPIQALSKYLLFEGVLVQALCQISCLKEFLFRLLNGFLIWSGYFGASFKDLLFEGVPVIGKSGHVEKKTSQLPGPCTRSLRRQGRVIALHMTLEQMMEWKREWNLCTALQTSWNELRSSSS